MTAADLTLAELVIRLQAGADDAPTQAAVELLVEHGYWLRDPAFLGLIRIGDRRTDGAPIAVIDWATLWVLADDEGVRARAHRAVLDVAHSLAAGHLRHELDRLDPSTVRLVAQAVLTAGHAR